MNKTDKGGFINKQKIKIKKKNHGPLWTTGLPEIEITFIYGLVDLSELD